MFRGLLKFSLRRTPLQAFGWYLAFCLIGGVLGAFVAYFVASGGASFAEAFQSGRDVGAVTGVLYDIVLSAMLLWNHPKMRSTSRWLLAA